MVTSTEVGIVLSRKGEEPSNVSNRPSRKPKWVDGGNLVINSVCVLEAINVNSDSRVCKGRQLTDDFDIDSAVIKFNVDECGRSLKKSAEDTKPSIETKLDFGILFRIPGESDSNPFKNRSLSFGGTWCSAHWLTANIDSAELRHGCVSVENNFGEHPNTPTKLMTMSDGIGSVKWPYIVVKTKTKDFLSSGDMSAIEIGELGFVRSSSDFVDVGKCFSVWWSRVCKNIHIKFHLNEPSIAKCILLSYKLSGLQYPYNNNNKRLLTAFNEIEFSNDNVIECRDLSCLSVFSFWNNTSYFYYRYNVLFKKI